VARVWGKLDFLVHCIAFADKNELTGRYVDTSASQFQPVAADLLLFLHRSCPARRKADDMMAARW
jgi:enoyl-[acyl-carrier protein] reductase I